MKLTELFEGKVEQVEIHSGGLTTLVFDPTYRQFEHFYSRWSSFADGKYSEVCRVIFTKDHLLMGDAHHWEHFQMKSRWIFNEPEYTASDWFYEGFLYEDYISIWKPSNAEYANKTSTYMNFASINADQASYFEKHEQFMKSWQENAVLNVINHPILKRIYHDKTKYIKFQGGSLNTKVDL